MNQNSLIIAADAARARLFRLRASSAPRAPVELVEVASLVRPEARIKEGDRFDDSAPLGGRSLAAHGHGLDDHREDHEAEALRRFAKQIAEVVSSVAREHECNPIISAATHTISRALSTELSRRVPKNVYLRTELGELTELSPSELLRELRERGVLGA